MDISSVLCSVLRERSFLRREHRQRRLRLESPSACFGLDSSLENSIVSTSIFSFPSYKEPTVDALAPEAEEGRGWLRKATGSCRPSFDPWISEWGNPLPVMG